MWQLDFLWRLYDAVKVVASFYKVDYEHKTCMRLLQIPWNLFLSKISISDNDNRSQKNKKGDVFMGHSIM